MDDNQLTAAREKIWPERDIEGKLEALRQQVLQLSFVIADWRERLARLEVHQHSASGQLLAPLGGPVDYSKPPARPYTPMGLRDKE